MPSEYLKRASKQINSSPLAFESSSVQSYLEIPLYLLSGLLGSGHCIGMCGGFVLAIGLHGTAKRHAIWKQAAYSLGRCFTYAALGALLGGAGKRVAQELSFLGNAGAILAIVAGVAITLLGIESLTGHLLWRSLSAKSKPHRKGAGCVSASLFASVFRQGSSGLSGAFAAGIATGFLPCGLLYGMLSIAAASQSVPRGALIMLMFGLGTSPALMAFGILGRSISQSWRSWLYRAAAASLLIAGGLSCFRGVYALQAASQTTEAAACPFCAAK
jgi:sulfite exporter TauE/SafE